LNIFIYQFFTINTIYRYLVYNIIMSLTVIPVSPVQGYLTESLDITFFKRVYRRHMEKIDYLINFIIL